MRTTLLLALLAVGCAPGDGVRFQVMNMERPGDDVGMAPPADYRPCYEGEARGYDRDGDGHVDSIRVSVNGKDHCYGEDTDHDGKIDTWDVTDDQGRLTKRAHDANGDGKPDQAWTFDPVRRGCATVARDANGDGKPDPGSPVDICTGLGVSAPAPASSAPVAPSK